MCGKSFWTLMILANAFGMTAQPNLLYNSGFELGTAGFSSIRTQQLKTFRNHFDPAGGIFIEDRDVKQGNKALKLVCVPRQYTSLHSSEFELDAGVLYTFSFWARSSVPVHLNLKISSRQEAKGKLAWKTFECSFALTAEWKPYVYSFQAASSPHRYYNFSMNTSSTPVTVLLDALQLERGDRANAWQPSAPIEVAVELPEICIDEKTLTGKLRAVAYDEDVTRKIDLRFRTLESDKTATSQTLSMTLKKNIPTSTDFHFNFFPYGCQQVIPVLNSKVCAPGSWGTTVHCHRPKWIGTQDGFKLGMNTALLGRYTSTQVLDSIGDADSRGKMLPFLGNMFRIWNPAEICWSLCNPAPGQFDFSRILASAATAAKNGVMLEVCLGTGWCWPDEKHGIPEWTFTRDLAGKNYPSSVKPGSRRKAKLPYYEDWEAYIVAAARTLKGKVRYYDLMNESNIVLNGATYARYMKIAHDALKRENPQAVVVGLSATEDLGSRALEYIEEVLQTRDGGAADIITFHPYGARQDDSPVPAQERIRQIKAIMRKTGVERPLWDDECFYLKSLAQSHYMLEHDVPVGAISRRLLIDMGEGLFASTPLSGDQVFDDHHNPHRLVQSWDSRMTPSKRFAEMNAAAYFLVGAKPLATVESKGEFLGYVFSASGKLFSAIWAASDPLSLALKPPAGSHFTVYDLYGNPLVCANDILQLTRQPVYLEWQRADATAVAAALRHGECTVEIPMEIGPARWCQQNGQTGIAFLLHNRNSKPLDGFIRINSSAFVNRGGRIDFSSVEKNIPHQIFIPLEMKDRETNQTILHVLVSNRDKIFEFTQTVFFTPLIHLKEGEWSKNYPIRKLSEGQAPAAEADTCGNFSLYWDKDFLSIRITVTDDHAVTGSHNVWAEDCLELFLDFAPFLGNFKHPELYGPETRQFFITPYRQTVLTGANRGVIPDMTVKVEKRTTGYEALIRVPLNAKPFCIGFDVGIDDADTINARKTQLLWTGTKWNFRDRSTWGMIFFAHRQR